MSWAGGAVFTKHRLSLRDEASRAGPGLLHLETSYPVPFTFIIICNLRDTHNQGI